MPKIASSDAGYLILEPDVRRTPADDTGHLVLQSQQVASVCSSDSACGSRWPERSSAERCPALCVLRDSTSLWASFCTNAQGSLSYSSQANKHGFDFSGNSILKSLNCLKIVEKYMFPLLVSEHSKGPKTGCLRCPHCVSYNC